MGGSSEPSPYFFLSLRQRYAHGQTKLTGRLLSPPSASMLLLDTEGESVLSSSLTSSSQLTLVLTENIKKQIHHHCIEVAARFWTVDEDRC